MPNIETTSELADHLADLLGIYGDIRCEALQYYQNYPTDFIGPTLGRPEELDSFGHVKDCDCRVNWVLGMADRIRRSVVNEFSMDLFNRPITTGTITGRLSSTEPNLQDIPLNTPLGEEVRKQALKNRPNRSFEADYASHEKEEVTRSKAVEENFKSMYGVQENV